MELSEVIEKRTSVRRYRPDSVPEEKLKRVLNAGRRAPSWGNVQPWRFIIVKDEATKRALAEACRGQKHVERAPVLIVCCGDLRAWGAQKQRLFELVDAGALRVPKEFIEEKIMKDELFNPSLAGQEALVRKTHEQVLLAIQNIHLAAVDEGLGSCIVAGGMMEDKVKEILNIPAEVVVTAILTLGYPDKEPAPRPRVPLEELVFHEEWGKAGGIGV
jgi:nitroreductase